MICSVLAACIESNCLKAVCQQCLTALRYIGSVTPAVEEEVDTLRPRTQALGTDLAASMLAQRFASPKSSGIQQLCQEISTAQALKAMPGFLPHHHTLAEAMPDQIAAALVSVVDRSSQCSQQSLTPEVFIPHVVHQFVSIASTSCRASGTASDSSSAATPITQTDSAELAVDSRAMAFKGDVCGRFCRRGYASIVAKTCWQLMLELHQAGHSQQTDTDTVCQNHHHQHYQQQQQQHQQQQQQQQQQELTNTNVQQQQQQLLQPSPLPGCTNTAAALAPASEQASSGVRSHHAASCIIRAIQDPTAVEKLLSCLLQSASSDLQHLDKNVALLFTVIQPLWARETVRYTGLLRKCLIACMQMPKANNLCEVLP